MDYFAQLISRDRQRDLIREADEARLGSLVGSLRRNGKSLPRIPRQHRSER